MTVQTRSLVVDRMKHHAQHRSGATAIVHGDTTVTYADLATRVRRLCRDFACLDLHRETLVMVSMPRGPEHVAAMLAVWDSGLAYLPVDPRDPPRRREEIRRITGARVTVEPDSHRGDGLRLVVDPSAPARTEPRSDTQTAGMAYVIFTSGSTGTPKGIAASHDSLSTLIEHLVHRYDLTADDRVLQFAAPTFDTAIERVGVALAAGASLVLPEAVWAPSQFNAEIARTGVTVMDLTPSYWREVVAAAAPPSDNYHVRLFILGGAAVTNRDLKDARDRYRHARILNAYGLTETGITTCLAEITTTDGLDGGPAAIGHPVEGATVTVLDSSGTRVRSGQSGHVAVAGRLALGTTRGDSSLDPLATTTIDGERFYFTGDTGYVDPARGLVITGRCDRQVKIRGFRVDPDEVENLLRRHPDIRDCAVASDPTGSTLRGYYTIAADQTAPRHSQVLAHLRALLPAYAVPSVLNRVDALPQTRHGKIDYRTLVAQTDFGADDHAATPVVLDTAIEQAVASVWTQVLDIERDQLGIAFFDAGGTSIAAAELVARVRASLGIHVRYVRALIEQLLRHPQFSGFCQAVAEARAGTLEAQADPREVMEADLARSIRPDSPAHANAPVLDSSSTILLTGATGFLAPICCLVYLRPPPPASPAWSERPPRKPPGNGSGLGGTHTGPSRTSPTMPWTGSTSSSAISPSRVSDSIPGTSASSPCAPASSFTPVEP